jgi:hypothetical protein
MLKGSTMTNDSEARKAVSQAWEFLLRLLDRDATPGVLEEDREQATRLLRNYPYPSRIPDFAASETMEGRTFDAIETTQDAIDKSPHMVEQLNAVLDLLTEYLGMIRDERRRNTEAKGKPAIIDRVSSL